MNDYICLENNTKKYICHEDACPPQGSPEKNKWDIMVVVLPVPEPEFAKYGPLKQGINEARIDKRVRDMTEYYEMVYIQRSETDFISEEDTYFWNHAHFQDPGREVFTPWIANRLMMINDGDGP